VPCPTHLRPPPGRSPPSPGVVVRGIRCGPQCVVNTPPVRTYVRACLRTCVRTSSHPYARLAVRTCVRLSVRVVARSHVHPCVRSSVHMGLPEGRAREPAGGRWPPSTGTASSSTRRCTWPPDSTVLPSWPWGTGRRGLRRHSARAGCCHEGAGWMRTDQVRRRSDPKNVTSASATGLGATFGAKWPMPGNLRMRVSGMWSATKCSQSL
jgi:hypothetical protein